jgi:hypothetical protein
MSKHSGAINKIDDRITELEAQVEQIEWTLDLSLLTYSELEALEQIIVNGASEHEVEAFLAPIEAEGRFRLIKKRRQNK